METAIFQRTAPAQVVVDAAVDATVCFGGKEDRFGRVEFGKAPGARSGITECRIRYRLPKINNAARFHAERIEDEVLEITRV